jgi:type I restriction enzyme S subunit
MSAQTLITEHLELWTQAVTNKSTAGRGSNGKVELTGIKKLRELILELAVRGKLVEQDPDDESVKLLFNKIESEKCAQLEAKTIRKPKKLPSIERAEQPFSIPNNWRYCRLNDIGTWGSGATPKRGNLHYYGGKIPWFKSGELYKDFINRSEETITDLAVQETSVRMNQPGDVLIAMYGATIGKASILEVAGTTNQAVCACTPWRGISNRFLLLLLKTYRARFTAMGAGGAQPNISRDKIIATVIGLPPEQEQHRIVQKVDELMDLCDRLEQHTSDQLNAHETLVDTLLGTLTQSGNATELADNWARLAEHFDTLFTTEQSIDKLKQTILQLAVMGRLVEQDAGDEPATELLKRIQDGKDQLLQSSKQRKAKPLPPISESEEPFSLPSGWTLSRLDDITDIQGGIAKGKKVSGKTTQTLPYLRVANVQRSSLDLSEIKEIEIAEDEVERYLVRRRDLLITEGGDWDKVGRTAIWDGRIEPMAHQNHVFRARLILAEQNERWLERYLNSQFARDYFAGSSKQTTNLASINKTQLRSCTVPLPPMAEQNRIVQKVEELMALCDQLKERLNQASETRCQLAGAVVEGALEG